MKVVMNNESIIQTTYAIHRRYLLRIYLLCAASIAVSPALAQNGNAAYPGRDESAAGVVTEIVVTARKRAEPLQNIPLSVSAFDAKQLEKIGAGTLRDLQHAVPGLQYSERGILQTELTIRGVGGDSRNIGIESGVGKYVDGVYIPRTSGYNSDLAEVEQIEVLRGPQGTLFGKNTIGGVINIISRKPADRLEGVVSTQYGNYNALRIQAAASVPITENLFGKVTVASWDRDGYIYNIFDGQDYQNENRRGARGQLRYVGGEALEINMSVDVTKDRTRTALSQVGSPAGAAAPYYTPNRFQMNANRENINRRDMWGGNVSADYTLENDMTITYIGAYRKIDVAVKSDIDQLPIDIFHTSQFTDVSKMVSQELRVVSPGSAPLRYVAGLYYYHQKGKAEREAFIGGAFGFKNLFAAVTDSYAAYLNVDYDILPDLTATGGVRYTHEKKTGRLFQVRAGQNYDLDDLRRTDENISWTGSLTYKVTRDLTVYGAVSRGFKSGGFNLDPPSAANLLADDLTFGPEKVTNYEIGAKGRISDLLRFNLAGFYMDYKDKQVVQIVPTSASIFPSTQITNAGVARIYGIELDATLTPVNGLNLTAGVARLDAKYTSFEDAGRVNGVPISFSGNRIERTPDWTLSGQAEYRFDVRNGELALSGTTTYTGDVHLQPDNSAANFQRSYVLIDGRIAYEMENGITLAAWGKNLTQKGYKIFSRLFSGLSQVTYGEPRTYGLEARLRF